MTIDWTSFTPWTSLAGGLLIGVATVLCLIFNGRIAGVSGIVGGLLNPKRGDISWRVAFVSGLVLSPLAYALVFTLPKVASLAYGGLKPLIFVIAMLVGTGLFEMLKHRKAKTGKVSV